MILSDKILTIIKSNLITGLFVLFPLMDLDLDDALNTPFL